MSELAAAGDWRWLVEKAVAGMLGTAISPIVAFGYLAGLALLAIVPGLPPPRRRLLMRRVKAKLPLLSRKIAAERRLDGPATPAISFWLRTIDPSWWVVQRLFRASHGPTLE
jgi:hypothetical protein